ncbi:MAG: glycosyltransferase [Acidobacteria bacterium]|nr:glycosyltransferase [Acidobacteriota bacterium]
MRILHLATTYPLHPGDSNATFVASIAEGLAARGHECDVLVPWHPELQEMRSGGVTVTGFRYSPIDAWHPWGYAQSLTADRALRPDAYLAAPLAALAGRRWVRRLHRERHYHLLHAHWFLPNGAIAASAWRGTGLPLVVSCHGSGVYLAEKHGWAARLGRYVHRHAGAVTACSADLARRVDRFGEGAAAVRIPYGVDTDRFAPLGPARRASARTEIASAHGLDPEAMWVFAIGRLVYKKGFEVLIKAAGIAAQRGVGLEVVIAGAGPLERQLTELADFRGVGDRVHLVGAVPNRDVPRLYAASDVVAVPSVHDAEGNVDGLPNTLMEGLSSGAAVVASEVAGIPDVLRPRDNGLLFAERDENALADLLSELATNPALRQELGERARADATANLDWEQTVTQFEQVYRTVNAEA